ncbi:MAG: membrane protein insertion efficiency factor YidD [Dehalococcoidia bacterium]|nr:membrane protein insertion efficiency factor YidD [Dehalococcoidia bacterium]
MKRVALWLIRGYQLTWSRIMPSVCRFEPSCSQYTYEAIQKHGFFKGILLGGWRIARCNPLNPGGYDPVP